MPDLVEHQLGFYRRRKFYTPFETGSLITVEVQEDSDTTFAQGLVMASPTDISVSQQEVSNFGISGVDFPAAEDLLHGIFQLPYDMDPSYPIGYRIHWTNSAGASANRGVTWVLRNSVRKQGLVLGIGIVVLTIPITESLVTGAWFNEVSPRGIMNDIQTSRLEIEAGAKMEFRIEADVVDSGVAAITYLGLEFDYAPVRNFGHGRPATCPLSSLGT